MAITKTNDAQTPWNFHRKTNSVRMEISDLLKVMKRTKTQHSKGEFKKERKKKQCAKQ